MMKIILVLSVCITAALGETCYMQRCPPGKCCTNQLTGSTMEERIVCLDLTKEGGRCFHNYTADYDGSTYGFYCPCAEGLYCDESKLPQTCRAP